MTRKKLIVLTKNFGTNFTGATMATCRVLENIEDNFTEVVVVAKNIGDYNLKRARIVRFSNVLQALKILKDFDRDEVVCYSDDHLGFLYKLTGKTYCHVYHGNWPEAMLIDPISFIKGFYFIPIYSLTLYFSRKIFSTSVRISDKFISKINRSIVQVKNGSPVIPLPGTAHVTLDKKHLNVLMVGSVDLRKYRKALALFKWMQHHAAASGFTFDIYGHAIDKSLVDTLNTFDFVNFNGFTKNLRYKDYDLYLSTSLSENLSLAICESLAANVPIICFDVGGLREIIVDGKNGFLIPRGDTAALANLLTSLQSKPTGFIFDNNFMQEFSWPVIAKQYLEALTDENSAR